MTDLLTAHIRIRIRDKSTGGKGAERRDMNVTKESIAYKRL